MRRLASFVPALTAIVALVFLSAPSQAGPIVGIGNVGPMNQASGILYSIDPLTGAVTAVGIGGGNSYFPVSSSPFPNSYFALSPINHYLLSYPQAGAYGSPGFALWECPSCPFALVDYAYDSLSGKLFSLNLHSENAPIVPAGLVLLTDTGTGDPFFPYNHNLTATIVASAPSFPNLSLIEYVQGLGLYGTDGHAAYLIDETTGAATTLPSLVYAGPTITGLAYDPDSGRLIGVSGSLFAAPGTTSNIYNINPLTGQVTLLNSNAPDMFGIAMVSTTPESSSIFLLAAGMLCVGLWQRYARRAIS